MNIGDITTRNAWRRPGADAIVDVPNGRRLTFARAPRSRRTASRGGCAASSASQKGDRVAILSTNAAEIAEAFFACGKAGLVAQPLNWRLAPAEQARILADAEPSALSGNRAFAADVAELQRRHDLDHWLDFAAGRRLAVRGRSSRASPADEPAVARRDRRRRPVLHPLHRRHDRHLEGRAAQPRDDRSGDGEPDGRRAGRDPPTSTCCSARCSTSRSCSR